jgi:hypothetical protein
MDSGTGLPLFDVTAARIERDKQLQRVHLNNRDWSLQALPIIASIRGEFTGENARLIIEQKLGAIPNPHLMGNLIMQAIHAGFIRKTGRHGQMTTKKSHARETPIYEHCE